MICVFSLKSCCIKNAHKSEDIWELCFKNAYLKKKLMLTALSVKLTKKSDKAVLFLFELKKTSFLNKYVEND